eukprot:401053-Pleurochrysis_carterae.AAC.6
MDKYEMEYNRQATTYQICCDHLLDEVSEHSRRQHRNKINVTAMSQQATTVNEVLMVALEYFQQVVAACAHYSLGKLQLRLLSYNYLW